MKHVLAAAAMGFVLLAGGPSFAADKTITLDVEGMSCASCPYMVKKSLTRVDGVKAVEVSLQTKLAVVTFDDARTNVEAMTTATLKAGFPSRPKLAGMNVPSSAKAEPGMNKKIEHRGSN